MIGNDIVDLAQARQESNWCRKGFLDKVFTTYEQQLIQSASDPDAMVWTLWSMKESAYKVIVRETGQRFFAPQQLACHLHTPFCQSVDGHVFYQRTYQTMSLITTQYVASVAFSGSTQPFIHEIFSIDHADYQYQYDRVRKKVRQYCLTHGSSLERAVQIQKNKVGVPTLVSTDSSGKVTYRFVSLSHHGQYGAFVLLQ